MLITNIQLAALYRARHDENMRKPFYLYVDEIQSFISLSFADILAEARKYRLSLFLSHQYTEQLNDKIRAAIFGNVGTLISFRIGAVDAEILEKEFDPVFNKEDLINLPKYSMYLKLMIDGATSRPFSAETVPIPNYVKSHKGEVITSSRQFYGNQRQLIEEDINNGYQVKKLGNSQTLFE
jgi:hypothetical protein